MLALFGSEFPVEVQNVPDFDRMLPELPNGLPLRPVYVFIVEMGKT